VTNPFSIGFTEISMISGAEGWAVGNSNRGKLIQWKGDTITLTDGPSPGYLYSIAMTSADNGWAVGSFGVILHGSPIQNFFLFLPMIRK
jgi:hypothetical protein